MLSSMLILSFLLGAQVVKFVAKSSLDLSLFFFLGYPNQLGFDSIGLPP